MELVTRFLAAGRTDATTSEFDCTVIGFSHHVIRESVGERSESTSAWDEQTDPDQVDWSRDPEGRIWARGKMTLKMDAFGMPPDVGAFLCCIEPAGLSRFGFGLALPDRPVPVGASWSATVTSPCAKGELTTRYVRECRLLSVRDGRAEIETRFTVFLDEKPYDDGTAIVHYDLVRHRPVSGVGQWKRERPSLYEQGDWSYCVTERR